ncbi:Zinc Transporter 5 [Manis pentadactyla]|nr:Zinc Transporter 5 [Manis pentadactyla]
MSCVIQRRTYPERFQFLKLHFGVFKRTSGLFMCIQLILVDCEIIVMKMENQCLVRQVPIKSKAKKLISDYNNNNKKIVT